MRNTIIKTTIKDNQNVSVKESVKDVFEMLNDKGSFLIVTRLDYKKNEGPCIIKKSSIKMVK